MGFLQPVDPQDPVQPLNQLNMSTGSTHSLLNLTEPHRTPSGTLMDALQDPYPQRFQSDFTHRRHVSLDESSRPSNPASLWQPTYIDRPASVPVLDTPTGSTENLTINTSFEPSDPPKPLGRYICSTCQTRFTRRSALEKHSLTHTTYASSHSPPSTTSTSSTSSTSLTTTPSGKKLCPHCPTSFLRPHDLHRHIRTKHTSDRPFKCPNCPASFSRGIR
ncbi:hypothetical protein BC829DRAFT_174262 [Chytridium lagenaria]|nr:hypothetical protein BC829DRAFT_174262 [Chytridium lagenaria]